MNIINFISSLAMPLIILLIVLYGLLEKKKFLIIFWMVQKMVLK